MISDDLKHDIDSVIGKPYTPKIIAFLTENGILNDRNKPFSASSIRMIVLQKKSNKFVELYIQKCVDHWAKKQ